MNEEKLEQELAQWKGVNKYIEFEIKTKLRKIPCKPTKVCLTKKQAWDLKRDEQFELLMSAGIDKKDVPKYEQGRVDLILKMKL